MMSSTDYRFGGIVGIFPFRTDVFFLEKENIVAQFIEWPELNYHKFEEFKLCSENRIIFQFDVCIRLLCRFYLPDQKTN